MRIPAAFFAIFALSLVAQRCRPKLPDLAELRAQFATAPYIAQGDGWGEARRRRLLQQWLQGQGFDVSVEQVPFTGIRAGEKYRAAVMTATRNSGAGGKSAELTLSVIHPPRTLDKALPDRQRACDDRLFAVLGSIGEYAQLRLQMSESCTVRADLP